MTQNSAAIHNVAVKDAAAIIAALSDATTRLPQTVLNTLAVWQKRAQDRACLRSLDSYLLKDMGLNAKDVAQEVSKPFWRS